MDKPRTTASVYEPPGGVLIWIILFIEFITFTAGLAVFLYQRKLDPSGFLEGQAHLSKTIGVINTVLLLTSGLLMAMVIRSLRADNHRQAFRQIVLAMAFGSGFLILKSIEYIGKIDQGFVLGYDTFYTFYWLLTGFHFIHVMVGVVILGYMAYALKRRKYGSHDFEDVDMAAVFWHMCDLIWLFLFPVIYLIH